MHNVSTSERAKAVLSQVNRLAIQLQGLKKRLVKTFYFVEISEDVLEEADRSVQSPL